MKSCVNLLLLFVYIHVHIPTVTIQLQYVHFFGCLSHQQTDMFWPPSLPSDKLRKLFRHVARFVSFRISSLDLVLFQTIPGTFILWPMHQRGRDGPWLYGVTCCDSQSDFSPNPRAREMEMGQQSVQGNQKKLNRLLPFVGVQKS